MEGGEDVNLTERTKKIGERLQCPMCPDMPCMGPPCAHYNPKTDECFHVEAARAQVEAAKELSVIAQVLECETINIRLRE